MARRVKVEKVRVKKQRKFNLSTWLALLAAPLSLGLIVIAALDLAGVISFKYLDPNWLEKLLDSVDLDKILEHLPENFNDVENVTVFEYETDYNQIGTPFRKESKTDYKKKLIGNSWEWTSGSSFNGTGYQIVPQDFYSYKLNTQGSLPRYKYTITPANNMNNLAVVPGYTYVDFAVHPNKDFRFEVEAKSYSYNNVYNMDLDMNSVRDVEITNSSLKDEIDKYKSFAYSNYLNIDQTSKEQLYNYVIENGVDPDSPTLVDDIVKLLSSTNSLPIKIENNNIVFTEYSMENRPNNMSIPVYFATQYHVGLPMHFGMAATLMMRTFGIPARYVDGYRDYIDDISENNKRKIGIKEMWGWTEVWDDNSGWVSYDPSLSLYSLLAGDMVGGNTGKVTRGKEVPSQTPVALYTAIGTGSYDYSSPVYLRYSSYGDYSTSNWGEAPEYSNLSSLTVSPNYWFGTYSRMMNQNSGYMMSIMSLTNIDRMLTPSYSVMPDSSGKKHDGYTEFAGSPIEISFNDVPIEVYSYNYQYFERNLNIYQAEKRGYCVYQNDRYDAWVRSSFLNYNDPFNADIKLLVDKFIADNELKFPNRNEYPTDIKYEEALSKFWEDVTNAVNSLAASEFYADKAPADIDPVIYLLSDQYKNKKGNHTMLASVETLVLRALGVPARYVTGFVAPNLTSGVIYASNAYAWVEAYEEGRGWRRLDPTSTIRYEGQTITTPGEMDKSAPISLNVKGKDITMYYDGSTPDYVPDPMTYYDDYNIQRGDTVTFKPASPFEFKDIGTYIAIFKAVVTDSNGRDVTDCYNITPVYGTVRILPRPILLDTPDLEGLVSDYSVTNPFMGKESFDEIQYITPGLSSYISGKQIYETYRFEKHLGCPLAWGNSAIITNRSYNYQIGTVPYTVDLLITNIFGEDITRNYLIDYYHPEDEKFPNRPGNLTLK